jgi:hypothetical protein
MHDILRTLPVQVKYRLITLALEASQRKPASTRLNDAAQFSRDCILAAHAG